MQESIPNFIKIPRILNDGKTKNSKVESESINVNDIKGFRHWHKGDNDQKINGDFTLIILKTGSVQEGSSARKVQKILINENCDAFQDRIAEIKNKK